MDEYQRPRVRTKKKYSDRPLRLKEFDYASNASYFVTICTYQQKPYFGRVVDELMRLSQLGRVAWDCWGLIPTYYNYVFLESFIVMPNHIHGVLTIRRGPQNIVGLQDKPKMNHFGAQSGNLGAIIRGYKVGVKKYAINHGLDFCWQPRFYDRIVRNSEEFLKICEYIEDNPANWDKDKFYM